ncbi:MAG: HEAT repeat domain-containing protein [Bacteriovoracia bacterium]
MAAALLWIAATGPAQASKIPDSEEPIHAMLVRDLKTRNAESSFKDLVAEWEYQYGPKAVAPLIKISSDQKQDDTHRYIALMAAARLGGDGAAPLIEPFLTDRLWMLRTAAIRTLSGLSRNREVSKKIVQALRDKALVVRSEAVQAVERIYPKGDREAIAALMETVRDSSNYHRGKAQWVPQKAVEALVRLADGKQNQQIARSLMDSLGQVKGLKDPALEKKVLLALTDLTGKNLASGASLPQQMRAWKIALAK